MEPRDRPSPPRWFKAWVEWHKGLHPRGPWPDTQQSAPFYLDWAEQFAERGVTEEEATEASRRLRRNPPGESRCPKCGAFPEPFPTTHPALLLRLVAAIRCERSRAAPRAEPATPDDVEARADERSARWEAASPEDRERVEGVVRAANPGIERRTPGYYRLLCTLALTDPAAAEGLLKPARDREPGPAERRELPRRPKPWWSRDRRAPFVADDADGSGGPSRGAGEEPTHGTAQAPGPSARAGRGRPGRLRLGRPPPLGRYGLPAVSSTGPADQQRGGREHRSTGGSSGRRSSGWRGRGGLNNCTPSPSARMTGCRAIGRGRAPMPGRRARAAYAPQPEPQEWGCTRDESDGQYVARDVVNWITGA